MQANQPQNEETVQIAGHSFTLRTSDKERLQQASSWLNARIQKASAKHPLLKTQELYLLVLLELSFERADFLENGRTILKETDQLLEWISGQLR